MALIPVGRASTESLAESEVERNQSFGVLRYASDLKDEDWALVAPLLPTSRLVRPRPHPRAGPRRRAGTAGRGEPTVPGTASGLRRRRPYGGPELAGALRGLGDWTLRIVKRGEAAGGFAVLPRRWVVERTFAWVGPQPPAREDFEATIASALAWLMVASIQLLVRRLANP